MQLSPYLYNFTPFPVYLSRSALKVSQYHLELFGVGSHSQHYPQIEYVEIVHSDKAPLRLISSN